MAAGTLDVLADTDPGAARRLDFAGQGVGLVVTLFLRRRNSMTAADAQRFVRDGAAGRHPRSRRRRAWDSWVRHHGAPDGQLLAELAELHAVIRPGTPDGTVELTPAGAVGPATAARPGQHRHPAAATHVTPHVGRGPGRAV